jgi:hypothetical protein
MNGPPGSSATEKPIAPGAAREIAVDVQRQLERRRLARVVRERQPFVDGAGASASGGKIDRRITSSSVRWVSSISRPLPASGGPGWRPGGSAT